MGSPRLSVLIVNWNSKEFLRKCLNSFRIEACERKWQIIVVDGGSFDGCSEMLADAFPEVEFIQSAENAGFGRTNNLGFQRVRGELVLLLNPDTEAKPGALQSLVTELERRPDAGILGPRLLNSDGSLQTSCVQSLPTPWNQALDSEFLRRIFPSSQLWGVGAAFRSSTPVAVEAVSGACMLLRTEVFHRVGGFSPEYFMYVEDLDLCAKVRRLGLLIIHVPNAEVVHHGGGSSRAQFSQFSTVMVRVANETYMRLNHGMLVSASYRTLQAITALVRLAILLPASFQLGQARRAAALGSFQKWCGVLRWAMGTSTIRTPDLPASHMYMATRGADVTDDKVP